MRLWSIDPSYLDSKGLVALWRETLLAKNVLEGKTIAYINHPQLDRFKNKTNCLDYINFYLGTIFKESKVRGYNFNMDKFIRTTITKNIEVNRGQIEYEFNHLQKKLFSRDPDRYKLNSNIESIKINEMFDLVEGGIEKWEKV